MRSIVTRHAPRGGSPLPPVDPEAMTLRAVAHGLAQEAVGGERSTRRPARGADQGALPIYAEEVCVGDRLVNVAAGVRPDGEQRGDGPIRPHALDGERRPRRQTPRVEDELVGVLESPDGQRSAAGVPADLDGHRLDTLAEPLPGESTATAAGGDRVRDVDKRHRILTDA